LSGDKEDKKDQVLSDVQGQSLTSVANRISAALMLSQG